MCPLFFACSNISAQDFGPGDIANILDVILKKDGYTPDFTEAETESPGEAPEESEDITAQPAPEQTGGQTEKTEQNGQNGQNEPDEKTDPSAQTEPPVTEIPANPAQTTGPPPQTEPPKAPETEDPAPETETTINRPSYATDGATILNIQAVFPEAPEKFLGVPYPGSVRFTDSLKKNINELASFSPRDFGGMQFYVTTTNAGLFTPFYSGVMLSDARRYRTELVEAECNIVTVSVEKPKEEILESIRLAVQTDEFISDILCVPLDIQSELVRNGYLMNLKKIPFLNLDAEYYNASASDAFTINGNVFGIVSDLVFDPSDIYAVFYNKTLAAGYSLKNPADLYKNGKWDFDGMFSVAKEFTAASGLNGGGDGPASIGIDAEDSGVISGLFSSSGGKYFTSGANSPPVLNFKNEKTSKLLSALSKLFLPASEGGMEIYNAAGREDQNAAFKSGNVLFSVLKLEIIPDIANSAFDWGLLPVPALDAAGGRLSFTDNNAMCISVPRSTRSTEACGIITGAMSMASHRVLKDVYVREQMMYYLRDVDSVNILDEIIKEIVFSQYNAYSTIPEITGPTAELLKNAAAGRADFAAGYESGRQSVSEFFKISDIFARR